MKCALSVAAALTFMLMAHDTQAQTRAAVSGRVVDEDGAAVSGAEVELNSRTRIPTSQDGAFRFGNVLIGPVELYVRALGYEDAALAFTITGDTTVTIRLVRQPITLEGLEARAPRIDIRGRVTEARHELGVEARVLVRPGGNSTTTNGTGRYRLRDVPVSDSSFVLVESFGYLPQNARLATMRDTTIDFVMVDDPVARAMIERQVQRLVTRSAELPYEIEWVRSDSMNHAGTLVDVLRYQYNIRGADCVVLDERVERRFEDMTPHWRMLLPHEVHSIEIIDRGNGPANDSAGMIRIYTKRYVQALVSGSKDPVRMQFRRRMPPALCR